MEPLVASEAPFGTLTGRSGRSAERTVLVVGLLGGLLFAFVTPPFQSPDEPAHFRRADQIAARMPLYRAADGTLGLDQPTSYSQLIALCLADLPSHPERRLAPGTLVNAYSVALEPANTVFVPRVQLAPYTSLSYVALAAGPTLGRLLDLRPLDILYLMRLASLASCLPLVWAAVRLIPFQKWAFVLLALNPMSMFMRSSASPDGLLNAGALLLVAVICAIAYDPEGAPARAVRVYGLIGAASLVALIKGGYTLLNFLPLLIRPSRLESRRWATAMLGILAVSGLGLWTSALVARDYFTQYHRLASVDAYAQLRWISTHLLAFLQLLLLDCGRHALRYAVGFIGNFGWLDTPLPAACLLAYGVLLVGLAVNGGEPTIAIPLRDRALIAAIVASGVAVMLTAQYLAWTPVGAKFLEGVQGRYFLPLAPAALLLLYRRGIPARAVWNPVWASVCVVTTMVSLVRIWTRYHGW